MGQRESLLPLQDPYGIPMGWRAEVEEIDKEKYLFIYVLNKYKIYK
jgi:hypothetical protein